MAVAATLPNYKAFTFDGASSRSYGVYITGEGVFNAPERAVEMVSIPGRNGAYALDKGYFENIEVTYPAGIFAETESDFAQAVSDFRNFLCSKKGYCRLQDEYNPNEYRMAIYKSGLEVDHEGLLNGEFNIVFECKPQRWLTSGETKLSVANNGTINNTTRFDSQPMIECEGYGTLTVNGYDISIENVPLGTVVLAYSGYNSPVSFDSALVANGDTFVIDMADFSWAIKASGIPAGQSVSSVTTVSTSGNASCNITGSGNDTTMIATFSGESFTVGTSKTVSSSWVINLTFSGGTTTQITLTCGINYNGTNKLTYTWGVGNTTYLTRFTRSTGYITAESTVSTLGNPIEIDCEFGEVYMIDNGSYISLNHLVDLGSNLPVLSPGYNTVTYSNTFSTVKITPRWWIV